VPSNQVIDTVLDRYSDALGSGASAYPNHVYRGLNYQLRILEAEPSDLLASAWAVHDLGRWTEHTMDYLPPSVRLANELADEFHVDDVESLRLMIGFHHRVPPIASERPMGPWRRINHRFSKPILG
jgi:hypothetical protein